MNLLIYVEPLIELGRPYWKEGWATYFGKIIIDALSSTETGVEFKFCLGINEPINQRLTFGNEIRRVVFSQAELLAPFNWSYLDASLCWYKSSYSSEQLDYYAELMQRKFDIFLPDVIITFSPAPFLTKAFPAALTLHMEYSLFSRAPYPQSWYLDPTGMLATSFPKRFTESIRTSSLSPDEQELLSAFKEECRNLINSKSPFKMLMKSEREKYRYLILVPLQFSGYYGFDGNVHFKSQYEFLTHVLEIVPSEIGIVVTTHPDHPVLDTETLTFLRSKYPNMIFHETFEEYQSSSQYLLADVDAVVTVSSSVGLQALLFDKKLIILGTYHNEAISDSNDIAELSALLGMEVAPKDHVLFWYLTRYTIPERYFRNPYWLSAFLNNSLSTFRTHGIDESFFNLIDSPKNILSSLSASLDPNIPKPLVIKSVHARLRVKEAEAEQLSLRVIALQEQVSRTITYVKNLEATITRLEQEISRHRAKMENLEQGLQEREQKLAANQEILGLLTQTIQKRDELVAEHVGALQQRDELLSEQVGALQQRDELLAERDRDIHQRDLMLEGKEAMIEAFYTSFSWRITAPIRWIYNCVTNTFFSGSEKR